MCTDLPLPSSAHPPPPQRFLLEGPLGSSGQWEYPGFSFGKGTLGQRLPQAGGRESLQVPGFLRRSGAPNDGDR